MLKIGQCVNFLNTIGAKVVFLLSKIERYSSNYYSTKVQKNQKRIKRKNRFIFFKNVFTNTLLVNWQINL